MSEQIYSEEEITKILRRAIELEAERSSSGRTGSRKGLTVSELEEIAAESGIDPGLIQQAAHEINPGHEYRKSSGIKTDDTQGAELRGETVFSERWIDAQVDQSIMKEVITELNHRYDTSEDDITWWDNLWGSYAGAARVRKTGNSTEWHHTNEAETYTIRVLLQNRGNKFRIRISKKTLWGIDWQDMPKLVWLMAPGLLLSGGLIGYFIMMSGNWLGALAGGGIGLLLFSLLFPIARKIVRSHINKQKQEVTLLTNEIADFIQELVSEGSIVSGKNKRSIKQGIHSEKIIEIDDSESDHTHNTDRNREKGGGNILKNSLKE